MPPIDKISIKVKKTKARFVSESFLRIITQTNVALFFIFGYVRSNKDRFQTSSEKATVLIVRIKNNLTQLIEIMIKALPKRKVVLTFAVIIAVVLIATAVFVWESRPIVNYSMTGYSIAPLLNQNGLQFPILFNQYGPIYTTTMPNTYTNLNSNTPLIIDLSWENTGKMDTSVQLILITKNANITWSSNYGSNNITAPAWASESDGQTHNGTKATFITETKAQSGMQDKYVDIMPIGNPQNFTITFSVKDSSNTFASLFSNGTTTATYELTSTNVYQLVN